MFQPLIHWHTHWQKNQSLFEKYAHQMDTLQGKIKNNYMANLFSKRVEKVYGSKEVANAVLRVGSAFRKDGAFKKDFDRVFNSFVTMKPLSEYGLKTSDFSNIESVKKNINAISEYLNGVEKGYEKIAQFLGGKDISAFYAAIAAQGSVEELRKYYDEIVKKDSSYMIYAERFKNIDAAAQGKLRSIAQYFSQIQGLGKKTNPNELYKILSAQNGDKTFSEILVQNINSGLRHIIGFGFEYVISHQLEKIPKILGKNATIEHSGEIRSQADLEYGRSTADIKFKGEIANIDLRVPVGASVKIAKDDGIKMVHLRVKSGTTLGKMLDILHSTTGFMGEKDYAAFANLVANFDKPKAKKTKANLENSEDNKYFKTVGREKDFKYANMNGLLRSLNKVLMITGLAGSLTENDISTVFIVNNKILNIYDILKELGKKNAFENVQTKDGLNFTKIREVSSKHHYIEDVSQKPNKLDQITRSIKINETLRDLNLDLGLNLSQAFLRKFS